MSAGCALGPFLAFPALLGSSTLLGTSVLALRGLPAMERRSKHIRWKQRTYFTKGGTKNSLLIHGMALNNFLQYLLEANLEIVLLLWLSVSVASLRNYLILAGRLDWGFTKHAVSFTQ